MLSITVLSTGNTATSHGECCCRPGRELDFIEACQLTTSWDLVCDINEQSRRTENFGAVQRKLLWCRDIQAKPHLLSAPWSSPEVLTGGSQTMTTSTRSTYFSSLPEALWPLKHFQPEVGSASQESLLCACVGPLGGVFYPVARGTEPQVSCDQPTSTPEISCPLFPVSTPHCLWSPLQGSTCTQIFVSRSAFGKTNSGSHEEIMGKGTAYLKARVESLAFQRTERPRRQMGREQADGIRWGLSRY